MSFADFDSAVGYSFGLDVDGVTIKSITEVSGLKMEQDVIELKEQTPDGKYMIRKLPGRHKAGEVTLTRPLSADTNFEKWIKSSQLGKMTDARKNGFIIVMDYEGNPVKRYKFTNGWAKSLELGTLKAGATDVLTEKLTITHEGMEPES